MPTTNKLFLAVQRCCLISKRGVRDRFRPSLVAVTGAGKTYEERLNEIKKPSENVTERVNIGLSPFKVAKEVKDAKEKKDAPTTKWIHDQRKSSSRRTILNEINSNWLSDTAPVDLSKIADHYDVFKHLFGDAFFYPQLDWQITFTADKDSKQSSVVKFGNRIPASACLVHPQFEFKPPVLSDSSHWCLVMTALDGHLSNSDRQYVLWMVANLQGSIKDPLSKADVVLPYLPPFPPYGFGYCRVAFVLYKQLGGIIKNPQEQLFPSKLAADINSRDFSSLEWYKNRQELLTPGSLRFFQTIWDDSVTGTYHEILNMREPRYAYMTPEPYREEQRIHPPEDLPFNEYLDHYRDRKDIAEEVFKHYLYHSNPLGPRQPPSKYPNLKRYDPRKVVSWIRDEEKNKNLRQGKWKHLPKPY